MRPKTSVRQPIIAGARRQHLAEMLRTWRRQPRQRSRLLFWSLLALALLSDSSLLYLGTRLLGVSPAFLAPPAERHIYVPYAAEAALWEPLRHWVIRADGRTQLFESFCRQAVHEITGDERFEGYDPLAVAVSWWLDGTADSLHWNDYPCLRCEDTELRAVLYRDKRSPARMSRREQLHGRYVEPNVVSSSPGFDDILHGIRGQGGNIPLSSLERSAVELQNRLKRFQQIRRGDFEASSAEMETASAALRSAYQSETTDLFAAALTDFLEASQRAGHENEDPRRFASEAWLNHYQPLPKAACLSLLAAALFAAAALVRSRRPRWRRGFLLSGFFACLCSLGWAVAALLCGAIRDGTLVSAGAQGMLWSAVLVLGLSLVPALLGRDAFLGWIGALVASAGFFLANGWPPLFAEHWPALPEGITADPWLHRQVLLLLSAYATLALMGTVAALTLARILLSPPTGERVRGLTTLCLRLLHLGVAFLTASVLVDGCRALGQGAAWRSWNPQMLGTLLLLPGCAALVHARRRGWIAPFAFLAAGVFAFTLVALIGQAALLKGTGYSNLGDALTVEGWFFAAGFGSLSLTTHTALRYYFGRQRLLEA